MSSSLLTSDPACNHPPSTARLITTACCLDAFKKDFPS
jgi:hypothetical protein